MNYYICLFICFIVGISMFYLINSSCGCNVVEGVEPNVATEPVTDSNSNSNSSIIQELFSIISDMSNTNTDTDTDTTVCKKAPSAMCNIPGGKPNPMKKKALDGHPNMSKKNIAWNGTGYWYSDDPKSKGGGGGEGPCPAGMMNIKPTCASWWSKPKPGPTCLPAGSPCSAGGLGADCCNQCNTAGTHCN
jgi:hypothetical protein